MPTDTAFCVDTDIEPWILWGSLPADWVVKVMELSNPVGFVIYRFEGNSVILLKLCVRDDLQRTGIGTETLGWLIDRAKKRGYVGVECELSEEQTLDADGPTPIVSLLRHCNFVGRLVRGKYIFTHASK
jgi:GNAT superfamily N-acetyltransferase